MIFAAGEDQRAGAAEIRRLLEQIGVMMLDPLQMVTKHRAKRGSIVISHEDADQVDLVVLLRQFLGLLVVDHLETMFEPAQESVGFRQDRKSTRLNSSH